MITYKQGEHNHTDDVQFQKKIDTTIAQLVNTVNSLMVSAARDTNWMGLWVENNEYYVNDLVEYNGLKYLCIQNHENRIKTPDVDTVYWIGFTDTNKVATVEITDVPGAATNGVFSSTQMEYLLADVNTSIMFNSEKYFQMDIGHNEGTLGFFHADFENNKVMLKFIEVTIATNSWVLNTYTPS